MGEKTKVLWADNSHNWHWGCAKVAPECMHCYAETDSLRYGKKVFGPGSTTPRWILSEKNAKQPYKWNKQAQEQGKRIKVFAPSMSDLFEDNKQLVEVRQIAFKTIEETPWLWWQVLTKRPENVLKMIPASWNGVLPDHMCVGTSAGTQKTANKNIPELLNIPALVHFVSCEPMLEPTNFAPWLPYLQWMICGGESGVDHRHFNPEWAEALRQDCSEFNVPYFFKQHGGRFHNSGGDLLYGQEYKAFPIVFDRIPATVQPEAEIVQASLF